VAARAAQEAQILTPADALRFIERHGVVCESARRDRVPSLAEAIAGEAIRGHWWSHANSREIFAITRAVREAPDVLVCRLLDGKITFVHERLWPALVRIADRFALERLARVREVHSANGKHMLEETPFPDWVPKRMAQAGRKLDEAAAHSQLAMLL
jgi:hypothetical protein